MAFNAETEIKKLAKELKKSQSECSKLHTRILFLENRQKPGLFGAFSTVAVSLRHDSQSLRHALDLIQLQTHAQYGLNHLTE